MTFICTKCTKIFRLRFPQILTRIAFLLFPSVHCNRSKLCQISWQINIYMRYDNVQFYLWFIVIEETYCLHALCNCEFTVWSFFIVEKRSYSVQFSVLWSSNSWQKILWVLWKYLMFVESVMLIFDFYRKTVLYNIMHLNVVSISTKASKNKCW